jgi:hypothetical protein
MRMKSIGVLLMLLGYLLAVGVGLIGGVVMLAAQSALGIDAYVLVVYGAALAGCLLGGYGLIRGGNKLRRRG